MPSSVSVVIPAFNAQQYIGSAIDSALAQEGCEIEVIVVDDGSSDNTAEVVEAYTDRVRYVKQANAGPAAARNLGVSLSTSDWIAFLDADDTWVSGKLQAQLKAASDGNADVVYSNLLNSGDCDSVAQTRSTKELPRGDIFEQLLYDNFIPLSSVLMRRQLLVDVGGFREDLLGTEDWDLWMRLASEGVLFEVVNEPLITYQWRADSLSKDHERMKLLREHTVQLALDTLRGRKVGWVKRKAAMANALAVSAWFANHDTKLRLTARMWYGAAATTAPWVVGHWKQWLKTIVYRTPRRQ